MEGYLIVYFGFDRFGGSWNRYIETVVCRDLDELREFAKQLFLRVYGRFLGSGEPGTRSFASVQEEIIHNDELYSQHFRASLDQDLFTCFRFDPTQERWETITSEDLLCDELF